VASTCEKVEQHENLEICFIFWPVFRLEAKQKYKNRIVVMVSKLLHNILLNHQERKLKKTIITPN